MNHQRAQCAERRTLGSAGGCAEKARNRKADAGPRRAAHPTDAETARRITTRLIDGIAPGSYLIVSVGQLDDHTGHQFTAAYQAGQLHHHTREDIAGFLAGLELIKPGITEARAWRAPVLPTGQAAVARRPEPGSRSK
jgi:S-adenosyl methyltransferase